MAPDGTMLPSFHRHDYRTHTTVDAVATEHPDGTPEPKELFSDEWKEWNEKAQTVVKESRWSMVDGGADWYGRRGGVYTEMTVYDDDPFEVIRRFVCRGGRGPKSDQRLTWTPLFRINDKWLFSLLTYMMRNVGGLDTESIDEKIEVLTKDRPDLRELIYETITRDIELGKKGEKSPDYGTHMNLYLAEAKYRIDREIYIEEPVKHEE